MANEIDTLMDLKKAKVKWLLDMAYRDELCTCIECHLSTDKDGYCQVTVHYRNHRAHRLVYEQLVGPINGLQVLHHCDNPKCINPSHLFLGTQKDNMDDMLNKGRKANAGPATRALSEEAAQNMETAYFNGVSQHDLAVKYRVNQSTVSLTLKRLREERDAK